MTVPHEIKNIHTHSFFLSIIDRIKYACGRPAGTSRRNRAHVTHDTTILCKTEESGSDGRFTFRIRNERRPRGAGTRLRTTDRAPLSAWFTAMNVQAIK